MVFDEPISGLDLNSMQKVSAIVKKLASEGKIIFIVTHDYEFICECCTRVIRIDEGVLQEDYVLSEYTSDNLKKYYQRRKI